MYYTACVQTSNMYYITCGHTKTKRVARAIRHVRTGQGVDLDLGQSVDPSIGEGGVGGGAGSLDAQRCDR